jgi:hypothetical protein
MMFITMTKMQGPRPPLHVAAASASKKQGM